MKAFVLLVAFSAALAVAACKPKPAGPNNCQNGDTACDYTKG